MGRGDGGPLRPPPPGTLEETRVAPLWPLPPPCWPHAPPTSHPLDSGTEERPTPTCSGGPGAAGTALAPIPPLCPRTRSSSSSSTFSSVTCHRGRMLRWPPSPIFGCDGPRDGHKVPWKDLADGEEANQDPRAVWGGGRSGWQDLQHRHPSPGAGPPPGAAARHLAQSQGSRWLQAPRRHRSCPAGHSPGHRPASAAPVERGQ